MAAIAWNPRQFVTMRGMTPAAITPPGSPATAMPAAIRNAVTRPMSLSSERIG
jgi:hypothetical protein